MIVIILLLILQCTYIVVLADANANHYTEVEQDVWQFTKYLLVAFMGLIVWGLREFIVSVKALVNTVSELKTEMAVTNIAVEGIKEDVNFIRQDVASHGNRLLTLEKDHHN